MVIWNHKCWTVTEIIFCGKLGSFVTIVLQCLEGLFYIQSVAMGALLAVCYNALQNTIYYKTLQSHLTTIQTCGQLQLFLVQLMQTCACFLLHCVLLYKKQLPVMQSLDSY